MFFLPGFEDDVTIGGFVEGSLVLEFGREIDAIILTDVFNCLRR